MALLRPATVGLLGTSAGRVSTSRVLVRHVGDTPYPFTKPADAPRKSPEDSGAKAAYPFTKPGEPTQVPPPTRPVARPGPMHNASAVVSPEATEEPSGYGAPDYYATADYRTQYVL